MKGKHYVLRAAKGAKPKSNFRIVFSELFFERSNCFRAIRFGATIDVTPRWVRFSSASASQWLHSGSLLLQWQIHACSMLALQQLLRGLTFGVRQLNGCSTASLERLDAGFSVTPRWLHVDAAVASQWLYCASVTTLRLLCHGFLGVPRMLLRGSVEFYEQLS